MRQVVESSLKERRKKIYFVPFFGIQNNTSNSCLTDVLNNHLNQNMIFVVNNTRLFEEIPLFQNFRGAPAYPSLPISFH